MANRTGNGRQRQLGRRLRRMREDAGLTLDAAAVRLEFSASKLGRIENAEQGVDVHIVKSMLDLYDVGGDRWTETLQLVRDAREKPWYARYVQGGDYGYVQLRDRRRAGAGLGPRVRAGPAADRGLRARPVPVLGDGTFPAAARGRRRGSHASPAATHRRAASAALRGHHQRAGAAQPVRRYRRDARTARTPRSPLRSCRRSPCRCCRRASGPHASLASGFSVLSFGDLAEPDLAYVEHALGAARLESPMMFCWPGRSSTSCVLWHLRRRRRWRCCGRSPQRI